MTFVLLLQPRSSIRSRRGLASTPPLLVFGEPDVLAKAFGATTLGLVLRRVLDKAGRWVFRWMRPEPEAPGPPPGSKAWLDKLNVEYGPTARPAADEVVQILRIPWGKLSLATYNRGIAAIKVARDNPRTPHADKLRLLALWMQLHDRAYGEHLVGTELSREHMEAGALAASSGGASPVFGGRMVGGGVEPERVRPSTWELDASHALHAPPPDRPVEIDAQDLLRHVQMTGGQRSGAHGMRFETPEKGPSGERTGKLAAGVQRQRDYSRKSRGRFGLRSTRHLNEVVKAYLERRGFTIVNGAGKGSEEWFRGPGGGTKGGTFVDITAKNGRQTVRVQTVTTLADGKTPTPAEAAATARIRAKFPNDQLILIPKVK